MVPTLAGVALCALVLAGCVTEPAHPDGVKPRREVRVWSEDDPEPKAAAAAVGSDAKGAAPVGEKPSAWDTNLLAARRDGDSLFPPGLLARETPRDDFGPAAEALSPYHRFSHHTLRAPDGRLTRLYWVRPGMGAMLQQLIILHTSAGDEDDPANISVTPGVVRDPRPTNPNLPKEITSQLPPGVDQVSDLLTVTAENEVLLEVDQFLSTILTSTPQIEIESHVIEIQLSDGVETGVNLFVQELASLEVENSDGTISEFIGDDPRTIFSDFDSPLDPDAFLSGQQVGTLALSFFENDLRIDALVRAIQNTNNTDVLSAPKMAVLNGHRAVIDTGSRTPVLTPVLGNQGQLTQVQVKFEDTGIKLIVTPYLLMDDMIQVDVYAEVSFVSGFIESGATGILNPIISTRTASTVVNVRDGQTFAIGGLISTDEIELVTKIPILGDIPILGYLFKTTSLQARQSQVIFLVKPTLIRRALPLFDPSS